MVNVEFVVLKYKNLTAQGYDLDFRIKKLNKLISFRLFFTRNVIRVTVNFS